MFIKSNLALCITKEKKEGFFSIHSFPKLQNDLLTGKNKFLNKFNIQFLSDKLDTYTHYSLFKWLLSQIYTYSNFILFENWRFYCIGCAFLQYSCYHRSYLFVSLFLSYTDKTCDKIETKFALSDFMKKSWHSLYN